MNIKYLWVCVCAAGLLVSGCSNNDDDDGFSGGLSFFQSLYLANDQGSDTGSVERFDAQGSAQFGLSTPAQTFNAGLSEGIDIDGLGNLYQAGISAGNGTLRAACSLPNRPNPDSFTGNGDRVITEALNAPKGIVHVAGAGRVIVAEPGAPLNAIAVFSSSAGPGADPLFAVTQAALGAGAWDIAYDEDSDRLFAALVNGTIAYIPDFLGNAGVSAPSIFQPDNPLATNSNMHGIDYDAAADLLVVSDVGVPSGPDFDVDGSLYVFSNASNLSGTVTADSTIRGPSTLLGNPVDLRLAGNAVIVAEKSNGGGQLLAFDNIASGADGDIAPDLVEAASNPPESLVLSPDPLPIADDISDLSGATAQRIFVTSNPGMGTQIFDVATDLSSASPLFVPVGPGQFVESIGLDQNGDAVVSFDDGTDAGGLSFVNRLALRSSGTSFDASTDRQITGEGGLLPPPNMTSLVSPKGFDVVGSRGLVIVADLNAAAPGALKIFSLCASGNIAPLAITTLPAGVRGWDVDYDPESDRLFAAGVDGTVLVFDDYLDSDPDNATPDRVIDPDDTTGGASNIHGIVHDADSDRLIISDVGDAGSAADGRIYVINNASTADGATALRLEIAGPNSMLGNPVDLAFDGSALFVAEKSNDAILRYDNILSLTSSGAQDLTADESLTFTKPESIALSP